MENCSAASKRPNAHEDTTGDENDAPVKCRKLECGSNSSEGVESASGITPQSEDDKLSKECAKEEEEEEKEALTIDSLFDEILQKIFSNFPAHIVFGVLSKVCMRWERIAKDPDTLGQCQLFLDDADRGGSHNMCIDLLKEASSLGEVYISPFYPQMALPLLIQGPKVRKLVIIGDSEWHPNWPSPVDLISLLEHNKSTLQQLSMPVDSGLVQCHKAQNAGVPIPSFQSIIAGMKRLTYLHLVGECWRHWDAWDFSSAPGHPHLRTLKIDSLTFISDECPFIRDLISLCKSTLKTLYLPCQLPNDAISLIKSGVFNGSLVENLLVSTGCLRVVSQMQHLQILAVTDNGKEDRDLRWFKESPLLSGVKKLTLQSVLETENEKEGFVWHLLSKFNHVEEFWGVECSVEEDTFNMFIKNNPSLKELHFLDFVGLENPNQVEILEKFLPNLSVIDIALSHISEEVNSALQGLSERSPNLSIIYGDDYDDISGL